MKMVIELPNSLYANLHKITNGTAASKRILDCVKEGVPIPKGHGRLIDANAYRGEMLKSREFNFFAILDMQPTIIEADSEDAK